MALRLGSVPPRHWSGCLPSEFQAFSCKKKGGNGSILHSDWVDTTWSFGDDERVDMGGVCGACKVTEDSESPGLAQALMACM